MAKLIDFDNLKPMHQRVINATCLRYNYQDIIDDAPNPESKVDFATRVWKEQIIELVKETEQEQARQNFIKNNPPVDITLN